MIDLEALHERHPCLLPEHTAALALFAATALQRANHAPGVEVQVDVLGTVGVEPFTWAPRPVDATLATLDANHITEFGAEALALSLVHESRGWVVRRRLQRFESADWLLEDGAGELVALEVSGTVDGDAADRMRDKLVQVAKADAVRCVACVVRFLEPAAWLGQAR